MSLDPEADQPQALVQRPPPYPLECAIEEAHSPEFTELPQDRQPEPWDSEQSRATATGDGTATGNGSATAAHTAAQVPAGHPSATVIAGARVATEAPAPPETLAQRLQWLPKWQARYVLSLYELGGIATLAAARCNVSKKSVENHQASNPDFAAACAEAVAHRTDLVLAATYRGATVGDLRAKYQQGVIVGYERVRDTRAAELMLRVDGLLEDGSQKQPATVTVVNVTPPAAVPAVVAETMARLFEEARRQQRVVDV